MTAGNDPDRDALAGLSSDAGAVPAPDTGPAAVLPRTAPPPPPTGAREWRGAPPDPGSLRARIAGLRSQAELAALLDTLPDDAADELAHDWDGLWARPEQRLPPGDWRTWLLLCGRGFGKSRTLTETLRIWARDPSMRCAVVARTAADLRDCLLDGPAGILTIAPPKERPAHIASMRRLVWPNGAVATLYSAEEPDSLRGPNHTCAIADEVATWQYPEETWSNLQLTLRLGAHPRVVAATTPRPIKLLRDLIAAPSTVTTRGSTFANAAHLAPSALQEFRARYAGTRLGRQELDGELLLDTPGALWSRELLDGSRVTSPPADLVRIVVGVDPAISAEEGSDLTGIVACGRDERGHVYVLADRSVRASPAGWSSRVVALYDSLGADRVIAEANQGGAMVESVLRTVRPSLPVTLVHASRGKVTRAEPVAAMWEQGRGHLVGMHPELEDELTAFAPGPMPHSPDRADAMVWAVSSLMEAGGWSGLMDFYREAAQAVGETR